MTIKELIDELHKHPETLQVRIQDSEGWTAPCRKAHRKANTVYLGASYQDDFKKAAKQ